LIEILLHSSGGALVSAARRGGKNQNSHKIAITFQPTNYH
jgi:hypothetical protein